MRKAQRFSPKLLARFRRQERGTGIGEHYLAWHQVRRSEPGSCGRSHLLWSFEVNRSLHLLSDHEARAAHFARMTRPRDLREQFPLSLEVHRGDLTEYGIESAIELPGTNAICDELKVRRPSVADGESKVDWVFTTDLVLTYAAGTGVWRLLAISVKPTAALTKRQLDLHRVQKVYWERQSVDWLLLTPEEYDRHVGNWLTYSAPWALDTVRVAEPLLLAASGEASLLEGLTQRQAHQHLRQALQLGQGQAPYVFWQAVWSAQLLLDMRTPCRTAARLSFVTLGEFQLLNPIHVRRTAWK